MLLHDRLQVVQEMLRPALIKLWLGKELNQ